MTMTEEDFDAKYLESILERNPQLVNNLQSIHPWRWRLLAVWIVAFTILAFISIRANREQVHDLQETKASVHQLENTNCALRKFLATAAEARQSAAEKDKDPIQRATDLRAAVQYRVLAEKFDGKASCKEAIK